MVPFHIVLGQLAVVDPLLFRDEALRVAFLHQGIALVFLVGQDAAHRALIPHGLLPGRQDAHLRQAFSDGMRGKPLQEEVVDQPHRFRLFLVDHQFAVFAPVVAEEMLEGHGDPPVSHALALAPGAVF